MLIAKVQNGRVVDIQDYTTMFPNTSFTSSGPSAEFLIENSCMYVNTWMPYDPNTQKLVPTTPYISVPNPEQPLQWVYTVEVTQLTPEEIEKIEEEKRQENKNQAVQLLQETDWTTIPDVANPTVSNPYLANQAEFVAYRNQIRQIAVYPPATTVDWPTPPVEIWGP
jgi:hypothetical protein